MPTEAKRAVVLLSGGLDSATVLAIARTQGYELYALSFSYGQRHVLELEAASRVAASIGVASHRIAAIDLRVFGGSALTGDFAVPKGRAMDEMSHGIPITYVPRATPFFFRSRWPGLRCWARATSSSASTRWTTRATPTAGRSLFRRLRRWPTWRPAPVWKAARRSRFTRR